MRNRLWDIYKAVRRRQEHTGGGDGDDATDDETDEDGNDDVDVDDGPEGANKRKKPKKTARGRFSKKTLDAFEESEFYVLIDAVYISRCLCLSY
jgi:hypothetical protein